MCSCGMTSNILARKLNDCDKNEDHYFTACGIFHMEEIERADLVLIAPQIGKVGKQIEDQCKKIGIPCYYLKEDEFLFDDVDTTYQKLSKYLSINEEVTDIYHFNKKDTWQLLLSFLVAIAGVVVGYLYLEVIKLIAFKNATEILEGVIINLASIFLMTYYGFQFGKMVHESPLSFSLISLGSLLLISPFSQRDIITIGRENINISYLLVSDYGLRYLLVYFVVCNVALVLFYYLYVKSKKTFQNKLFGYESSVEYLISTIPGFVVFTVVLFIKLALTSL